MYSDKTCQNCSWQKTCREKKAEECDRFTHKKIQETIFFLLLIIGAAAVALVISSS